MSREATSGGVLVVGACAETEALLHDALLGDSGVDLEHSSDTESAIARVERGESLDAILLSPRLPDPVRVAQRLLSLDRLTTVVILVEPEHRDEVAHALEVAPFLDGDVVLSATGDAAALARDVGAGTARTQARRAQQASRKARRDTPPPLSARYLGTLLDSAPIGIVTLDAAGAVMGWNKRAGAMLGVPEVEALGTPFADLFERGDRPRLHELVEALDAAGIGSDGTVARRGGRTFELTGARFAIRSGETGALLILQDVTERLTAEREAELQSALVEAQADAALAGIAIVGLDGSLERINRRWSEIWGIDEQLIRDDRDEATRRVLAQVEDPEAFMAGTNEFIAAAQGDYLDEVRLKDGRTIERYGAYVRSASGQTVGRAWFHTDISARKHEEDALRFLADATNLLSSSLDYETTLQSVAELAVRQFGDWCAVDIGEPGRPASSVIAHADPAKVRFARDFRARFPADPETGAVARTMRTGESQVWSDIPQSMLEEAARDEEHLRMLRELAPRSVMVVPIKIRGRVLGAITFLISESGHRYDADDVELAEELGRRAAIAIDNSRVHAQLRHTARTLQESLLPPHLPHVAGVELAARFRPAGTGTDVGGDFYDVFDTAPAAWGIAIGDVCGKGAEAAALTAMSRYTVRAAAMYERSAGGVLGVVNQALLRQHGDFRFTTLAFCVLERGPGEGWSLRCATGGHPRPLLLRAGGGVEPVGAAGPLLGVIPDAEFGESAVALGEGDVIALYTDGLTDARAPERTLGEADVVEALRSCQGRSAAEVAAQIEDLAVGGSTAEARDDIALLVLKIAS